MNVDGVNSKGINLNAVGEGKAINNGEINLTNGGVGILTKAQAINEGKIYGNGIGVQLANGLFINSGIINTTKNAIESVIGTNNTVYLKKGNIINGKIIGNTGIDILAVEGLQTNLNIAGYEGIIVRSGDATIVDSKIALEYNKGTKKYLIKSKNDLDTIDNHTTRTSSKNLTLRNSKLVINFKDSLTNSSITENPIIDTDKLIFSGKTNLVFNSSDGRTEFDVNEALGLMGKDIDITNAHLNKTAVWDYHLDNGKLVARKQKYQDVVKKAELKDFATLFEQNRSNMSGKFFNKIVGELDTLATTDDFTRAMAQMSGGIHGYTVDIAAINTRTLVNSMRNRALNREYLLNRPTNSWIQDLVYIDNRHKIDGLMSASYDERGGLGISEKQIFSNGRLGFVYGGSRGKANFDNGNSGNIVSNNAYLGGYYNYDFDNNISLNSNFSFVYGHNKVNRKINIGNYSDELKAHYPTYAIGLGTNVIYRIKDDNKNKALFYAGVDVGTIMQGNINEKAELKPNDVNATLMIKNAGVNEFSYYSITPNVGLILQNSGYIFGKKYLIGADVSYETELGNIKDSKKLNMLGIPNQYKVGTFTRENVISAGIFGQLDLTKSLAINANYKISKSVNYDNNAINIGLSYKFASFADNLIIGSILKGIENSKPSFERWKGTVGFAFEMEDNSDRVYYDSVGNLTSGDYASSTLIKPKLTLSLADQKYTNWSYYFETFYQSNDFLKKTKENEGRFTSARFHGEARWKNIYSQGHYGMTAGYRYNTAGKPVLSTYPKSLRLSQSVHQLRLTPNFLYKLGYGFAFEAKPTVIVQYNSEGVTKGQTDYIIEAEYIFSYAGFMPRWNFRLGYYREDRWLDDRNVKLIWDSVTKNATTAVGSRRYQLNQLRPAATYYFGNGNNLSFAMRLPLGRGAWYSSLDNNKKFSESYETRYTVDYTHLVTPGFNIRVGISFLDIKSKNTDRSSSSYGKITKSYSFRPSIGFNYSF